MYKYQTLKNDFYFVRFIYTCFDDLLLPVFICLNIFDAIINAEKDKRTNQWIEFWMLSFVQHRNMNREFLFFFRLNIEEKKSQFILLSQCNNCSLLYDYYMDNERERKRREKGREKEEKKFSHCSYDRITRNSSSSRKQQRTYKLIPFSSLLLSQWWFI